LRSKVAGGVPPRLHAQYRAIGVTFIRLALAARRRSRARRASSRSTHHAASVGRTSGTLILMEPGRRR
jgi:hypothetical protein